MNTRTRYLVTGAAGAVGGVSRRVVTGLLAHGGAARALVRTDDSRAQALRDLGAEVVVGDLTNPADVAAATADIDRMFFNMSVSDRYLEATAVVCAAVRDTARIEILVNMSQMTVSQMTPTSTAESRQQRLHWLAEKVIDWSGVPAAQIRATVFLENPLFSVFAAQSIREHDTVALPFGDGRTSPVAAADVADVVTEILLTPGAHVGNVYELTGPRAVDLDGLADAFTRGLGRPIGARRLPDNEWLEQLTAAQLPAHVEQHIATMARLHADDRYNRATDTVEHITGHPAQTIENYVREHHDLFDKAE
jgi:uncharacterized protein YbjT (DUF2867 family)